LSGVRRQETGDRRQELGVTEEIKKKKEEDYEKVFYH
jgi:hypothetical protein